MKAALKPIIEGSSTMGAVLFSIANINAILTTIVLVLTAVYWVLKIKKERSK